jgi:myo-inositol 2-dehydrogenase / D-chiro-inositol 1-dehydrogenase
MRVGLVGTGSMGNAHIPSWQHLKDRGAELVGVVANRAGSAEAFAKNYNIKAYPSYEALLKDVDIVDLCIPTNLHREMTVQAAQAGKHVICEKPIALTIEDARTMISVCQQAGVRLFIAHVLRFVSQYSAAKAAIDAGHLGNLGVIRLKRVGYQPRKAVDNWFVDESRSGGMMLDLMIHDYDYARWLAGDVSRVFAKSVRAARPDAPGDYALVTLRFSNGTIAHIEGGWAYPPGFFRTAMDIAGTGGLIEWSSDNSETFQYHLADAPQEEIAEVAVPSATAADSPFTTQLRHFYEAIQTGDETLVTAADGLAALQIGLAARESARTGKSITIEQGII